VDFDFFSCLPFEPAQLLERLPGGISPLGANE
jgi:hypothetical protein